MELIELTKVCTTCFIRKSIREFHRHKTSRFGVKAVCKICCKNYNNIRKEEYKDYFKEYYIKNKEKRQIYEKTRRAKHKDKLKAQSNEYYAKNKTVIKKAQKIYNSKRKEKTKLYNKEYRLSHKDEINAQKLLKQKSSPKDRLNHSIRNAIRISLNGNKNGRHWESIVGYTLTQLINRLEKQFTENMAWDNYGKDGWWIDHKIPISAFNFTKPEHTDFKKAWALKNLQPMWGIENIKKGANLTKHFQPSLLV